MMNIFATAALSSVALVLIVGSAAAASVPDPWSARPMLAIAWKKGPDLPQGFQDSGVGIIGNMLVTTCGFCSGKQVGLVPETQSISGKEGKYPRGFLKKTWALDLGDQGKGWQTLPDFPGAARQHGLAIVVEDQLYYWGGYSYSEPFSYRDGYRLSRVGDRWDWHPLLPLPESTVSAGMCAIGSKIYVFGGAQYDGKLVNTEKRGSAGEPRQGVRLLTIDTKNLAAGWQDLPPCPGTPRMVHATAAVNDRLYVFGGAAGNDNPTCQYCTVVDNWCYDPASARWSRLPDLPVASGNFVSGPIVYADRYVLLVGGFQYGHVLDPDGRTRLPYGRTTKHYPDNPYNSDVFVFDALTNTFGTATPLPFNSNLSMEVVRGNEVHLLGGETGGAVIEGERFGHHPDLYLAGHITLVTPGARIRP
jgi:N-acetylneuraminic acid mutarotase